MSKQLGCREKVIASVLCLGVLSGTAFVANIWGSVQRDVSVKERVTPVLANVLYRLALEDRLDHIQDDRLGANDVAVSLRKAAESHGAIKTWEVVGAYPTPIGLPVFVVLKVQRNTKTYEVLTIQKGHFFVTHHISDEAGLRNLGLPSPP